ncbi:MAG TPA: class I SAM-dependent methyltransferase [bacterium]|nr:class I SAM-dependent methyltransferase [bacterium]
MAETFDSNHISEEYLLEYYRKARNKPWQECGEEYLSDPGGRFRMELLLEELYRIEPENLLDLGCGSMVLGTLIEGRIRTDYFGCDIADIENGQGAKFFLSDVSETGIRDEAFQAVVCSEVLEHLYDPERGIREIYRIMRNNGYALITVPNLFSFDSIDGATGVISGPLRIISEAGLSKRWEHGINVHVTRQSPSKWRKMIQDSGLEIEMERAVYLFPYIPYIIKPLKKLETRLFSSVPAAEFWQKLERRIAYLPPLNRLGQFHYFRCRKNS